MKGYFLSFYFFALGKLLKDVERKEISDPKKLPQALLEISWSVTDLKSLFKASLAKNEPYYRTLKEYHRHFNSKTFLWIKSEVFFEDLRHKKVSFFVYLMLIISSILCYISTLPININLIIILLCNISIFS